MRAEDKGKRDKRVTESEFECISEKDVPTPIAAMPTQENKNC